MMNDFDEKLADHVMKFCIEHGYDMIECRVIHTVKDGWDVIVTMGLIPNTTRYRKD